MLRVDAAAVDALNAVDPAITLATLPDWARVRPRQMVATVKIIPYAVAADRGRAAARRRRPRRPAGARLPARDAPALILTRTPGMKESLLAKGAEAVARAARGARAGAAAAGDGAARDAPRSAAAVAAAEGEMVLILGGSATSDAARRLPGRRWSRRAGG